MTIRVSGGIINSQTLTGSLRYFKMTGPFAWAVSDGSVNLPSIVVGGASPVTTYFAVGNNLPVPNSAAELSLREITKQCDITIISCRPALYSATTELHFACSASAFGWGADLPEDMIGAAAQMQMAVRSLGLQTVHVSVGGADTAKAPATAVVNLATVVIIEVPFALA